MRKFSALFLIFAMLFVSCSGAIDPGNGGEQGEDAPVVDEPVATGSIRFVSDVDVIERGATSVSSMHAVSAAEDDTDLRIGEPIVGVLLKYGSAQEQGMSNNVCYLHYLGDCQVGYNGDGMAYNYILYSPSVILDAYNARGGQGGSGSGNAFWWYINEYFSLSMSAVQDNWYDVLTLLLSYNELPLPEVEDSGDSSDDWSGTTSVSYDGKELIGVLLSYAYTDDPLFRLQYLGDGQVEYNGDGMAFNFILVCPEKLLEAYAAETGYADRGSGDPFWWYMRTYHNLYLDEIYADWRPVLDLLVDNPDLPLISN